LSNKKIIAVFSAVIMVAAAVIVFFYFFSAKQGNREYESLTEGMKIWENTSVPGIAVYVPEDYVSTQNEYYTVYSKNNAQVSLTSETVDNDLANYVYYAIESYKDITDSFRIREEYEEELLNTTVHVIEFDYSLSLDSGIKNLSCLSAYVMGEGRSYVLTCVAPSEDFQLHREEFHRIYKTMTLVGKASESE